MIIQKEEPRNERDEINELLTRILVLLRKVHLANGLESLLLAKLVFVIKKLEHV